MSGPQHPYLKVPAEWEVVEQSGPGPFTTLMRWRRPDGAVVTWRSRHHRKAPVAVVSRWWWAPNEIGWWIGVLFAVGASCFLAASTPMFADVFGTSVQNVTYFVGSIFFTSAATCQFIQTQSVGTDPTMPHVRRSGLRARFEARRIDSWAAVIQLAGTLLFNRSTWFAMWDQANAARLERLVWTPDAVGSVCFLVASWLAWAEVCNGASRWQPRTIGWWVAAVNLAGSIAFGVSAVGAVIVSGGEMLSDALATAGTLVGAVCFLAGGVLLLPELGSPAVPATAPAKR